MRHHIGYGDGDANMPQHALKVVALVHSKVNSRPKPKTLVERFEPWHLMDSINLQ